MAPDFTPLLHPTLPAKIPKALDSINPKTFMTGFQVADTLEECGLPLPYSALEAKAKLGGGPPFRIFGKNPIYQWCDVVPWVLSTLGEPARTTQEHRARRTVPGNPKITQIA
jgi:hypothetical protein